MTRRFCLVLLLTGTVHLCVMGQNRYCVDLIDEHLKERADAKIRNEQIEIDMKDINDMTIRIMRAVTVYNRNGDEHGGIELYYNKSRKIRSVKRSEEHAS